MVDTPQNKSVVIVSHYFTPEKTGGASRIHDTAKHLSSRGWDITVLTPPPAFPHGQFNPTWERKETDYIDGITIHNLWAWQPREEDPSFLSRMAYYLLFPLHALLWLLVHYRDVDVILTTSPPIFTGIVGLLFSLLNRTSWIVDIRDLWIDASVGLGFISEDGIAEKLSRQYEQWVLSTADRITVTTSVLGDRLAKQYALDHEKIIHLPNGVETNRFKPTKTTQEPTIVYTGNIGHAQDLESCIRAMTHLTHPTASMKIVGDGDLRKKLESIATAEGLKDKVEFTGLVPRDEIPEILDEAMIGIVPLKSDKTLEYAVPTKAYEYMATGLPVIATGTGELESLIDESGGGYLVDNDPEEIADAFETLLQEPAVRIELGENGRKHMVENYDREVIAEKLSQTFNEVI